ncbi:tRNA (N(6)-L-threonylcarbamoyladenosine(37)-C(2))-methylthiotransferase MtaB [Desulfoscipio gibsoniae]|uniref:Threonylcarbamoyladenosine tRNA methylthiotransferase MtaB n=1 Tax=Desulfoscipio gibsoniae DSM 7213 TaxID=767817 RepID=R4KE24_9FIRM|nr:tRNA (N(6)-L-threonylcarbamoyladenosine(37)-C(2))-methylthiotransferase MtaB [Desulfoscipio gibsoniae]AGL00839.1 MiaB-like tRNA modifying enzyme [Desulfoscipio gibsoniae DSM 7213]
MSEKKVALTTLGCKVNQYESAALEELFRRRGYQVVDFDSPADVYIINTCTVTHLGDRKSRQLIRRAGRTNPEAVVAVTGCYAQTAPDEVLNVEGVDLVVGAGHRAEIVDLVENVSKGRKVKAVEDIARCHDFEELPGESHQGRVRAFLKIQEGCENYCSYCIIPYARGPLRSRSPENVLAGVRNLVESGFKEVVLTGIHTGAYGRGNQDGVDLVGLLALLANVPGLVRLRLSSLEPNDITPDLLDLMAAGPPFCRHLHIPLQSGDDYILKRMRRRYDTNYFRRLLASVRDKLPEVGITTDIMVGFPGEEDEHFRNGCTFVKEMQFSALHVFKYSPRRGTPAAGFPDQVDPRVKEERSRKLIAVGHSLAQSFAARFLGRTASVLVEQPVDISEHLFSQVDQDLSGDAMNASGELFEGLTDNYVRVYFPAQDSLRGQLADVKVTELGGTGLKGRIIYK